MKKICLILFIFGLFNFSAIAQEAMFEATPVKSTALSENLEVDYNQRWQLNFIRVLFSGSVGFQIPWIAEFTIHPQIEFIWE